MTPGGGFPTSAKASPMSRHPDPPGRLRLPRPTKSVIRVNSTRRRSRQATWNSLGSEHSSASRAARVASPAVVSMDIRTSRRTSSTREARSAAMGGKGPLTMSDLGTSARPVDRSRGLEARTANTGTSPGPARTRSRNAVGGSRFRNSLRSASPEPAGRSADRCSGDREGHSDSQKRPTNTGTCVGVRPRHRPHIRRWPE